MSTRKQMALAGGLVALAAAIVLVYTAATGAAPDSGAMKGHNHAVMAAGIEGPDAVHLSAEAARRIGIAYATAELRPFDRTVHSVASVTYDETRLADVSPKLDGWAERLYVDFTGAQVRRGQPLLDLYSPMLVTAQEELLLARRLVDESAAAPSSEAAANARALLQSARRRLAYWDIPADEIARIEESGVPRRSLTLRAPAGGVVVEKNVVQGGRITPGMNLFRIADLSRVWVEGDVFEKDLSLVALGQHARVMLDSYPGREFHGVVAYVYPTVSVQGRTGRVRVELQNPGLVLKPGMYANIALMAPGRSALAVPRSAVLTTGERALVFVQEGDGMLQPREVETGLTTDDLVEIRSGLTAGDVVVASAAFLVDAESNLGSALGGMAGMDMGAPAAASQSADRAH